MPTNTSEASSSGWRRASVAGSSRRRRTDRACDRTVADISSLRAFTDLLDAAADDGEVPTRRRLPEQMGPAELRRALGEADAQNDGLSSENARLREEVTSLEGMVDALMLLADRHGIDAEANDAGESKETALKVVDVDAETNDRAEVESSRPIGDCDSMLEHWLENHCVPAAETRHLGECEGTPAAATRQVEDTDGDGKENKFVDSPFEYHARDTGAVDGSKGAAVDDEWEGKVLELEGYAREMTAKKENVVTPALAEVLTQLNAF